MAAVHKFAEHFGKLMVFQDDEKRSEMNEVNERSGTVPSENNS